MPSITANDIDLNVEITGNGPSVTLLHGLGSSLRDWEAQVPALARKYQVITLDLRGHGLSTKPKGPYSISLFASDIAAVLGYLDISKTNVIGLSMGAAIGFHLALDFPDLVHTLTIANMGGAVPIKSPSEIRNYLLRVLVVKFIGMRKMGEILGPKLFPKEDQQDLRDTLSARWAENDKQAYLASMKALKNWTVMERLSDIRCPTQIIHAENDYTALAHKQTMAELIPNIELNIINDAGHAANAEKPEEFNSLLETFLGKHN